MNAQLPVRDGPRRREAASEVFLRQHLPEGWTWEKPGDDYGIDARVGIVQDQQVTGQELLVQLKSSDDASGKPYERIRLRVATYNYLLANLAVVLLVKYIASEEEAYWIYLRDVPPPNPANRTFTVRVPRENRVSVLDWDQLRAGLVVIHDRKLRAGRERR